MSKQVKCFHLSANKNRQSILLRGLEPRSYKGTFIKYEPRLYFSTSRKDLAFDYVNFENVDVWEFLVAESELQPDLLSICKNHFYITKAIAPDELKLVQCF